MLRTYANAATAFAAGTLLSLPSLATAAEVVTSIKPLELLVRAIAEDDVKTSTIVPAGSSPHTYSMRPSQRRALENADVIFWVGPDVESFLDRLLHGEEFRGRTVGLMDPENAHEEERHDGHHDHGGKHSGEADMHDHGDGEDPHLWLDPTLALGMAKDIHKALSGLKGADQETLDRNLARFESNLTETESIIRKKLEPAHALGLFAYHSAFTRFAEHYELPLVDVLTLNPELSPGARHVAEVQTKLREATHPCLLTEPQFNRQWWTSITEGLDVTFSTWDPLATDIGVSVNGYQEFQLGIAEAVLKCLPEDTEH
ncbi:zinc ABC transporter substrate-binding protein [Marinobacter sp. F4206]|uniref:zinc ABC transporter substrate-binding protein n=1 Tax=Marinobacter sp. F4206 TaxID=2861777 RepID=UPI001C5DD26B|nr:zinc ABC transporter substrate-binding protein [Marinobacter sp. F4206]MBW4933633.1 zinc ABC transporter substrate-binding protein [Marinobacter sp. F4206]